jgi:hypothetical protein
MTSAKSDLTGLLRRALADPEAGWSMGSFGAIAEFHQDPGEPALVDRPELLTRATARGAVRLDPSALERAVAVAYETPSRKPHRWSHGVALCLERGLAGCAGRSVPTELGPDAAAIRECDRGAILFDLGLALPQCDFCIRTSDPALIDALRAGAGRPLLDRGNPTLGAVLHAHPHRIAITGLGRVEVYQRIGGPETGGVSPAGPHTHVLPSLLRSGRTHSAILPIPDGILPSAYLYPGNPVIGPRGEDRAFDIGLHEAFQRILSALGRADLFATKCAVVRSIESGLDPDALTLPDDRHHRATARVALRQLAHRHAAGKARIGGRIARWRETLDAGTEPDLADGIDEHDRG